jgi:hypothetical protein
MNNLKIVALRALRKAYTFLFPKNTEVLQRVNNPDEVSEILRNKLNSGNPCMIARFGSNELTCLQNYVGIHNKNRLKYIQGKGGPWWWQKSIVNQMHYNAGFFPANVDLLGKYCELMLEDMKELDVLGSWLYGEQQFSTELKNVEKIRLIYLDPFWSVIPWTSALQAKKVLVIHPFAETIEKQYKKRKVLFTKEVLPEFELTTIKAVQSIAGNKTPFGTWFEALDFMKAQMDKVDYDICMVGAGAYGFHLAAHAKRKGKVGIHMGGSLQLLFGIRGNRWESNYNKTHDYAALVNEQWVRPGEDERPTGAIAVEGACYW